MGFYEDALQRRLKEKALSQSDHTSEAYRLLQTLRAQRAALDDQIYALEQEIYVINPMTNKKPII